MKRRRIVLRAGPSFLMITTKLHILVSQLFISLAWLMSSIWDLYNMSVHSEGREMLLMVQLKRLPSSPHERVGRFSTKSNCQLYEGEEFQPFACTLCPFSWWNLIRFESLWTKKQLLCWNIWTQLPQKIPVLIYSCTVIESALLWAALYSCGANKRRFFLFLLLFLFLLFLLLLLHPLLLLLLFLCVCVYKCVCVWRRAWNTLIR